MVKSGINISDYQSRSNFNFVLTPWISAFMQQHLFLPLSISPFLIVPPSTPWITSNFSQLWAFWICTNDDNHVKIITFTIRTELPYILPGPKVQWYGQSSGLWINRRQEIPAFYKILWWCRPDIPGFVWRWKSVICSRCSAPEKLSLLPFTGFTYVVCIRMNWHFSGGLSWI